MKKQQFFITVPIMDRVDSCDYEYMGYDDRNTNDKKNNRSRFPGVPMLLHNYDPESEAEIRFIRTITGKEAPEKNFALIKEEIANLAVNPDIDEDLRAKFCNADLLSSAKEICVDYDESYSKQTKFLKDMCNSFAENADIYLDITFGSKVSPVVAVSSLVFAENARFAHIKEIVYGLHAQSNVDRIFDVKSIYRIGQALNLASGISGTNLEELLDSFCDEE